VNEERTKHGGEKERLRYINSGDDPEIRNHNARKKNFKRERKDWGRWGSRKKNAGGRCLGVNSACRQGALLTNRGRGRLWEKADECEITSSARARKRKSAFSRWRGEARCPREDRTPPSKDTGRHRLGKETMRKRRTPKDREGARHCKTTRKEQRGEIKNVRTLLNRREKGIGDGNNKLQGWKRTERENWERNTRGSGQAAGRRKAKRWERDSCRSR